MGYRIDKVMLAGLLMGTTLLGGCATKKFVREEVNGLEVRQNAKMDQINQTAMEALDRATAAGKLAEGKFNYAVVLSDDSIKFDTGKAMLSPEAQTTLSQLAQKLIAENKNVYLEIQGYTDDVGTPARNLKLGEQRAEAALRFLHDQGIPSLRMSTISYGEEKPIAPNSNSDGRAANRRIVVVVLS